MASGHRHFIAQALMLVAFMARGSSCLVFQIPQTPTLVEQAAPMSTYQQQVATGSSSSSSLSTEIASPSSLSSLVAAAFASVTTTPITSPSAAIETIGTPGLEEGLLNSLQPATKDRPQIKISPYFDRAQLVQPQMFDGKFPTVFSEITSKQEQIPSMDLIVEGLVYLSDPNGEERPGYSDTMVLTVQDAEQSTTRTRSKVIAAAKIPVSKIRFPFQFRMFAPNNLMVPVEEWQQTYQQHDLIVQAQVCAPSTEDAKPSMDVKGDSLSSLQCPNAESTFSARGIAKVAANLPGMMEGEKIRTRVSIRLEN